MTVPALIVHDADDPDVPYGHGAEIAAAWPAAELVTTSGLGHRGILRDPEVIAPDDEFLRAACYGDRDGPGEYVGQRLVSRSFDHATMWPS